MNHRRYLQPEVDRLEDYDNYRPGGLHPIMIDDILARGRYKVIHKLGFGASSAVWMARDLSLRDTSAQSLVTLKVLSAEWSPSDEGKTAALQGPQQLHKTLLPSSAPTLLHIQRILDHFVEIGPNGQHLCLVTPLAGPSVLSLSSSPKQTSRIRRLAGWLARRVAKQVSLVVEEMHRAGFVHGGSSVSRESNTRSN